MHFRFNRSTLIAIALILSLYGQIPGTTLGVSATLAQAQDRNAVNRRSPQDRKAEADRLHRQGIRYFDEDQFPIALEKFQQALAIYREIGDEAAVGRTLNNLGMVCSHLKQPDRALEFLQQALDINREIGNGKGERRTLLNIDQVYEDMGQSAPAPEFYRQVLAVAQKTPLS